MGLYIGVLVSKPLSGLDYHYFCFFLTRIDRGHLCIVVVNRENPKLLSYSLSTCFFIYLFFYLVCTIFFLKHRMGHFRGTSGVQRKK